MLSCSQNCSKPPSTPPSFFPLRNSGTKAKKDFAT